QKPPGTPSPGLPACCRTARPKIPFAGEALQHRAFPKEDRVAFCGPACGRNRGDKSESAEHQPQFLLLSFPTHSANLLHPTAQCLSCEKGSASDDTICGTSNPEFPGKGVSVVAYSPAQRCAQRAPEAISHPGKVRGCASDLVVQEEVFEHSLETPEI